MASRNVDLGDDRTGSVISAAVASMVICITFYSLRLSARFINRTPLLSSDITLFGGVIACFVISSIDLYVLKLGLGRHIEWVAMEDPELEKVVTMLKFLMVNNCIYAFGQVTVKISVLTLYRHLFTSPRLHFWINLMIIFSIVWGVTFIGVALFSCRPIRAFWRFPLQRLPTTYCINNRAWYIGQGIPNILADIFILCMPIKQVWKLQLGKRTKIALTFIFLLGLFVCAISIIRVTALFEIDNADPTYTLVGIANWSSVEFAIAVMCASLPTLRPLVLAVKNIFWKIDSNTGINDASDGRYNTPRRKQRDFEMLTTSDDNYNTIHANNDSRSYVEEGRIVVTNTITSLRR